MLFSCLVINNLRIDINFELKRPFAYKKSMPDQNFNILKQFFKSNSKLKFVRRLPI
jgi:hypothetical protein